MTARRVPTLLLSGWLVGLSVACDHAARGSDSITVILSTNQMPTHPAASEVFPRGAIGIVCFPPEGAPTTVIAADARQLIERVDQAQREATPRPPSPSLILALPGSPPAPPSHPCDVVLFDDENDNGRVDARERYVTAWSGGRQSYRLLYVTDPTDHFGAKPGWNLIEGGFPTTVHPEFGDIRVPITPVLAPSPIR